MEFERERLRRCPLCGSAELRHWTKGADRLLQTSDDEFSYAACNACGLYFQDDRPAERFIGAWYKGAYGPYGLAAGRRDIRRAHAHLTPAHTFMDYQMR